MKTTDNSICPCEFCDAVDMTRKMLAKGIDQGLREFIFGKQKGDSVV